MKILGIRIPFTGKHSFPLLWFDNPEHIAINSQPSNLSLQDGRKKTLFERIFTLLHISGGLFLIIFPIFILLKGNFSIVIFGMVPTGVFVMSFIDRKRVLTIDGTNNQVKFEYVRWPRYDTINYELRIPISYGIMKKKRTRTHHEGGDDGAASRRWTTTHHGVDVAFDLVGEGLSPLLFLEGKNPQTKFESILELLSSTLGIKDEEDGQ